MSAVNRNAVVPWKGEDHAVKCTFAFIDLVNQRFDLNELANKVYAERKALNHSECAWVIHSALTSNEVSSTFADVGDWVQDSFRDAQGLAVGLISTAMFGAPKEPLPAASGGKKGKGGGKK